MDASKKVRVVVGALGTDDHGDAPSYAAFDLTEAFLANLDRIVSVCESADLTEARFVAHPDWGPGSIEDDLRLQCGKGVVTKSGCLWFTDYPKYADHYIQSHTVEVKLLKEVFESHGSGETAFLTDDQDIREMYAEDCSEQEAAEQSPIDRG